MKKVDCTGLQCEYWTGEECAVINCQRHTGVRDLEIKVIFLKSQLAVHRDIIKNIKESFIKAEYPFLNAIIESRLSKLPDSGSGEGGT